VTQESLSPRGHLSRIAKLLGIRVPYAFWWYPFAGSPAAGHRGRSSKG